MSSKSGMVGNRMFPWRGNPTGSGRPLAGVFLTLGLGIVFLSTPAGAGANTAGIIAPSDPQNPKPDSGWQAGTCTTDTPVCSVATPTQFFEAAAAHPQVGFTQFIVKNEPFPPVVPLPGARKPVGELKDVHVDLPIGLSVNPGATEEIC